MASSEATRALEQERAARRREQPLAIIREILEVRKAHAPEKQERDEAWMMLILLDSFETEAGIKGFVRERMTMCEVHGFVSRTRAHDCQEFDSWVATWDWQDCAICKWEKGLE